ncbi:unnamed protein product [Symbiodinium sp. CCMP2592]|nr:unnamed protein product [Symbiodinium sp. CCMP2592]
MGLLEALDLCVLNSWSARARSATYIHTKGKSQIDFVITRRLDAHPISRRSCPLPDAGLFEWRGGGRHLPLSVCVPTLRFMPDRSKEPQVQSFDVIRLREAVRTGSETAMAFCNEVCCTLPDARADTPQALNEHVMPILARHFPKTSGQVRQRPWQHADLQVRYPHLWQLWRTLGVGPPPGLHHLCGHVLRYWRQVTIYKQAAREAKRASRALRKQYMQSELRQAENAYRRGDQRGLFEVMRRLAPKQRKAKVQLRGEDGRILSNAEELRVFTDYCRGLFSSGRCVASDAVLSQPFQLMADDLERHMCKLSIDKSVPAHTLPPAVWKLCRRALAPVLVQLAARAWSLRPHAPHLWCDSWLVWLNKDTSGKIVTKHLASLLRTTAHCDRVRRLLEQHRSDIYARRAGKKALPCYGGLMMALDLSKAFDRVNREDLDMAMRQAKVDDDLRVIILQWHDSVHYHLRVHTHHDVVHCTAGVRQGCCLAPYLWALLSGSILARIAECTDLKWVQFLVNAYADDVHEAWEVESLEDLRWFERCVVATFAVLKRFHMIINEDKCVLVCAIRGHLGKLWLRRRTRPYKEGHALFLADGAGGEICLPLAKQMTYLGTILSYAGYEEQTLQHRLGIAELQRYMLVEIVTRVSCNKCVWSSPVRTVLDRLRRVAESNMENDGHNANRDAVVMLLLHVSFECLQEAGLSQEQPDDSAQSLEPDQANTDEACLLGNLIADDSDGCRGPDVPDVGARASLSSHLPAGIAGDREGEANTGRKCKAQATEPGREAVGQGRRKSSKSTARQRLGQHAERTDAHNQQNNQQELLEMAIKLMLRHEAFLSRLQMDMVYIFTFKNQPGAPDALLLTLYQVSLEWRNKYQDNPSALNRSLRVTILLCLLTELMKRVRRLTNDAAGEALQVMKNAGWLTSETQWVYQVWSHSESKLQTDENRGTMSMMAAIELLQSMLNLLDQPEILLKFAATRPLAQEMSGHQISFICEVSLRHQAADKLYTQMGKLMGHAMLHLASAVSFDGAWEARVMDHVCWSADGGSFENPISLELVASGSLQHAISGWHQQVYPINRQAYPHALSSPPRILSLRLNRFCDRDGGVRKDQSAIMLRPRLCVTMPLFADSHAVRVVPIRYMLTAGIYHLGESPDAGHYRAFVSGYSERNKKKFHVFDDN